MNPTAAGEPSGGDGPPDARCTASGPSPGHGPGGAPARLKGLDGLRAVAALGVLVTHGLFALPRFGSPPGPRTALAGFAVTIFFALSGFLITHLLLAERAAAGGISIRRFYLRRILRIWPLYFAYLFVNAALVRGTGDPAPFAALLPHLFLIPNVAFVFGTPYPNTDHYWTLGVEEQFYLFWPLLVALAGRRLLGWTVAFTVAFLALKAIANVAFGGYSDPYAFLYATRFDCMAIGGIGAWVFRHRPALARALAARPLQAGAWGLLVLAAVNRFHLLSIVDHEIMAAATVVLIFGLALQDERPALVGLESAPMAFLGRISYGIYVWHPAVIHLLALGWRPLPDPRANAVAVLAALLAGTVAVAHLSYRFLELPFLAWKERFAALRAGATAP